jgi:hypothetical protein
MPQDLAPLLARLGARHRRLLEWYLARQGDAIGWPGKLDGDFLASKPKAIYKPAWSDYALSVRQNLGSPYADREPVEREDGTWTYEYSPEVDPDGESDSLFTNASLRACQADHVPVAVIRELPEEEGKYRVHGLALVVSRTPAHFVLEGFAPGTKVAQVPAGFGEEGAVVAAVDKAEAEGGFDPGNKEDAREKVRALIARRRGQKKFRNQLIKAYAGACAVTGCKDLSVLEAAHIMPYRGAQTDHVQNGLLLRADIHTLFDLGLLAVEPDGLAVHVSPTLRDAVYRHLHGKALVVPTSAIDRPSRQALESHWSERDWAPPATSKS